MLRRRVDVCAEASDLRSRIIQLHLRYAEVCYLHSLLVCGEQKIIRLDVAVNDPLAVRVGERLGHLMKIKERVFKAERFPPTQIKQVAARHVFEHQIMKHRAFEVSRRAVTSAGTSV